MFYHWEFPASRFRVQLKFGLSRFLDLSPVLRPKFGLRIFLDQISVARSSSDLSQVLDRIWVLALRLAGRLAELDLAQCIADSLVVCCAGSASLGKLKP